MPHWTVWYVALFWPSLAVVTGLCVWKGDRPVRAAAATFATAMIVSKLLTPSNMFTHLEVGIAIVDFTLAIVLVALSVRYPRRWLMSLAAIQIVPCLGHISRMTGLAYSRLTYAILTGSVGYPAMILLLLGLTVSIRSRRIPTSRHA